MTSRLRSINTFATTLTVLGALALGAASLPAQAFEGSVTMHIAGTGANAAGQDIEYQMRGGKMRVNANARGRTVSAIIVPAEKKMYTILDAQRMYLEMSTDVASNAAAGAAAKAAASSPKITRTGKKEMIAGYECEHVLIESGAETNDVCFSKSLGTFMLGSAMGMLGGGMGRGGAGAAQPAWQRSVTEVGGFPLKITRPDGTVALEVTKVEKKSLPESLFTVPPDYSRMTMPQRPPG